LTLKLSGFAGQTCAAPARRLLHRSQTDNAEEGEIDTSAAQRKLNSARHAGSTAQQKTLPQPAPSATVVVAKSAAVVGPEDREGQNIDLRKSPGPA